MLTEFEIPEETRALLIKEAEELESKLQDLIDENEALRKGMHEILESIRSQDGKTFIRIGTCTMYYEVFSCLVVIFIEFKI